MDQMTTDELRERLEWVTENIRALTDELVAARTRLSEAQEERTRLQSLLMSAMRQETAASK